MSIFDRFESAVERGVNAPSRVFRSGTADTAIRRAMDESALRLRLRIIAANHFGLRPRRPPPRGVLDVLADEFAQRRHRTRRGEWLLSPRPRHDRAIADASGTRGTSRSTPKLPGGTRVLATASVLRPRASDHRRRRPVRLLTDSSPSSDAA